MKDIYRYIYIYCVLECKVKHQPAISDKVKILIHPDDRSWITIDRSSSPSPMLSYSRSNRDGDGDGMSFLVSTQVVHIPIFPQV